MIGNLLFLPMATKYCLILTHFQCVLFLCLAQPSICMIVYVYGVFMTSVQMTLSCHLKYIFFLYKEVRLNIFYDAAV